MKKKEQLKTTLLSGILFLSLLAFTQKPPEKFGKISEPDFGQKYCPTDSNAHAYYIFDYGRSYFQYADTKVSSHDSKSGRKGFQLYFSRHFRIKIVDQQGFSHANITIPLYQNVNKEEVKSIKAFTYNLVDGEVVKTKLEKRDILTEQTTDHQFTEKFAMPNVREGSIIEVEYTILSDFYLNLRDWYFQRDIPVLQSEYHVNIPEYFSYSQTQKGYFRIDQENDSKITDLTITYTQAAEGVSVQEGTYTGNYTYREDIYRFYARNIPAFTDYSYLRTAENYLSKIEFELLYIKYPETPIHYYSTDWEKINGNLLQHEKFGNELKKTAHLKQDIEQLKNSNKEGIELVDHVFHFIAKKLKWNGIKNTYVSTSLSKTYNEGTGNSADINLNLTLLLKELGFTAYPVILSTRDHGIIHPAHPSASSFNYVIALVKTGDDEYLLDATEPYSGINLLPVRCLNDKGRIVDETNSNWINLMNMKPYSAVESYKFKMDQDFSMNGECEKKLRDYAAYLLKKEVTRHGDTSGYYDYMKEKQPQGFAPDHYKINGLDSIHSGVKVSCTLSQKNYVEKADNIAFFSPVCQPFLTENPFPSETREYPVEYEFPCSIKQVYFFEIPEVFEISEMPDPLSIQMPEGKAKYVFKINRAGNTLTVISQFSINEVLFLPDEYESLKNFHKMIIDKQRELIVLKQTE
ncbi:MAG: DUF3857 domain-containing protein [Bacteroidales bacterium]|nr:DUF3857 domain-containing protein [Bacteroidales bacterium]